MKNPRLIRIFLSSPSDVSEERALARKTIDDLEYDPFLYGRVKLDIVAWDMPEVNTPQLATLTPQEAINRSLPKPSECEIVIVVFWSRMGTPLPPEYQKKDGSGYLSGTEWEYWDAVSAANATGLPFVLVYRRTEDIFFKHRDPEFDAQVKQSKLVDTFFEQFRNPDGSLSGGYNSYITPEDFRKQLNGHIRERIHYLLEEANPSPAVADPRLSPLWRGSPFPGLRAFTPADEAIFFGRGRETDVLVKFVSERKFVAVIGSSGSGKSSIVGAGLIPRLQQNAIEGSKDWLIPGFDTDWNQWTGLQFTPAERGDNPINGLASTFASIMKVPAQELLNSFTRSPANLLYYLDHILDGKPLWSKLLIFIDQFEELFTTITPSYIDDFVQLLVVATEHDRTHIVVTLRSDYYHRCLELPQLAKLLEGGSFPLSLPTPIALHDMIVHPAARAGIEFEDGLTEQIVNDTGGNPGSLALMAYTLDELYHMTEARGDGRVTFADYQALGKVHGAIGERAETVFTGLNLADSDTVIGDVFFSLVDVNEHGEPTRKRAHYTELTSTTDAKSLVDSFVNARLLVTSGNEAHAIVEVAHEALLRNWLRLAEWIKAFEGDLRLLKQVTQAAIEWDLRGRPESHLWPHERLIEVYDMQERLCPNLNQVTKEFTLPEPSFLLSRYSDADWSQQYKIERRLSEIGDYGLPFLAEYLHDPDSKLRKCVVDVLTRLENPKRIPLLIEAMRDKNAFVRRSAVYELQLALTYDPNKQYEEYYEQIIYTLIDALYDTSKLVRRYALEALFAKGVELPISGFTHHIESDYPGEAMAAIAYIAKFADTEEIDINVLFQIVDNLPENQLWWLRSRLRHVKTPLSTSILTHLR